MQDDKEEEKEEETKHSPRERVQPHPIFLLFIDAYYQVNEQKTTVLNRNVTFKSFSQLEILKKIWFFPILYISYSIYDVDLIKQAYIYKPVSKP